MKISVVIPVYNEAQALPILLKRIGDFLNAHEHEIIAVNDGSRDSSQKVLETAAQENKRIKVIQFSHNYGQTAALSAGITHASGDIIIPIDGDLENDPADIPRLLKKLEEGYDVVSGWRKNRWQNQWLTRKIPSLIANRIISLLTGTRLHDYGCTLKAYRREVIADVQLYGEMHRFVPAYAAWYDARITEIPVSYVPRPHGRSNYGISRTYRVLLDLILIRFLSQYMNRPMHFFGGLGFISLFLGTIAAVWAFTLRLGYDIHFVQTPLPVFAALFLIVGVQLTVMGILAEMLMRLYYESQNKKPYSISKKVNF